MVLSRPSALTLAALAAGVVSAHAQSSVALEVRKPDEVFRSAKNDVSPALRDMTPVPPPTQRRGRPVREHRIPFDDGPELEADPLLAPARNAQPGAGTTLATPAPSLGFDGLGNGVYGMTVNVAPPDTTGAVGATQYVQWVNLAFAVFDKNNGNKLYGPAAGSTIWQGMTGTPCGTSNDGDPVVQYDKQANRWVMSQFAVPGGASGYWQCIAVSQTADATGAWNRYAFNYVQFPDFPKMGVWPDGYYVSYNMFTNTFQGSKVCVMDRAAMLAGTAATQICFNLPSTYGSTLPSDQDGSPPALGTPNFVLARATNSLNLWRFTTNWSNPGASTLSGPTNIPVASFSAACAGGTCITQPNTSNKLDSLADRLNFRNAYRTLNGGTLVVSHAVSTGSKRSALAAVRWYELRNVGATGTPSVGQQGTLGGGDGVHRWMSSIGQDRNGGLALAYSASGASTFPSMRIATREATDPLGTMSSEVTVKAGTGSQTTGLTRWGDYSHLSIDPVDDCTFWATNEYMKTNGTWNWNTWITRFKLPSCQ
jgi:hypothetical protein